MIPALIFTLAQTVPTRPGEYLKASETGLQSPAYSVSGNDITLDFKGVVLRGTPKAVDPDQRKGLGVRIIGSNITSRIGELVGHVSGITVRMLVGAVGRAARAR